MSINERFSEAIAALGKKKAHIARDLGVSEAAVSMVCRGKSNPSNTTITAFCHIYGVNKEWLETGAGEMFQSRSREEQIAEYTAKMIRGDNEFQKALVELILTRSPEELEVIRKCFEDLTEKLKKE